ncbi:hypothetical protein QYE76_042124 [Lolium multiflorum]|uniref:Uncharacterized protein n=1 Tax=Lolium multiflorum TaxID=4521 RepID=A0AAD8TF22_LOLMU|nr:hypothetical protein QYE76_042124 [Lolium multiflorum]
MVSNNKGKRLSDEDIQDPEWKEVDESVKEEDEEEVEEDSCAYPRATIASIEVVENPFSAKRSARSTGGRTREQKERRRAAMAHLIGRHGPARPRRLVRRGPHSPLCLLSFAYFFVPKPKLQRIAANSHSSQNTREKRALRQNPPGKFLPEGEIDAIVTVIELDIISITIVIIFIIITAISTLPSSPL